MIDTAERRRRFVLDLMREAGAKQTRLPDGDVRFDVAELTPALAAKLLMLRHRQRAVRDSKVTEFAIAMKGGSWRRTRLPILFDAEWHLIDGQHRLEAVVRSKKTLLGVTITMAAEEDVALVVDTNGTPRSPQDTARFLTGRSIRRAVTSAIIIEKGDFGRRTLPMQNSQKGEFVAAYDLLDDAIKLDNWGRKVRATPGAIAAALRAIRLDGDRAKLFFGRAFANNHEVDGKTSHAARSLSTYLFDQFSKQITAGKQRNNAVRGASGTQLQLEIAERTAREYLRWRSGDRRSGTPRLQGSMPEEFGEE